MGWFSKINKGLTKTREQMAGEMDNLLSSVGEINDDLYSSLEELLIMHDVGVETSLKIIDKLRKNVAFKKLKEPSVVKSEIKAIVAEMLRGGEDMGLVTTPSVIMMIGVNGAGKTTTIGKLAMMYKNHGKKVVMGAADTFRAAAIDQLAVWAQRAEVDIIKSNEGSDPGAVVFDTIASAKAKDTDIVLIDTAGRLHNKKNLMEELAKIFKIIDRELPYSDREVLLVLDATTGQNAVNQAREFIKVAEITGIVLTKLDGTSKGGVVLTIKNELGVPVKFIGVGEGIDDLQPFNPEAFADGLFEKVEYDEEQSDEICKIDDEIVNKNIGNIGYEEKSEELSQKGNKNFNEISEVSQDGVFGHLQKESLVEEKLTWWERKKLEKKKRK